MNSKLVKILPVIFIALGLSACSKNEKRAAAPSVPEITVGERIDTTFQADCGGQPSAAVTSNYDISSCQLNNQQMALLRGVGPFSVTADCTQKSVEVKNAAGEISGTGSIDENGTYNVELQAGESFSVLEGCPVSLKGRATGSVVCKAQEDGTEKVESVTINTAFNFTSVTQTSTDGSNTDTNTAPATTPETPAVGAEGLSLALASDLEPGVGDRDRDDRRIPPKGGVIVPPKGKGGKIMIPGKGDRDRDRDDRPLPRPEPLGPDAATAVPAATSGDASSATSAPGVVPAPAASEVPVVLPDGDRDKDKDRDRDRDRDRDDHRIPPKGGFIKGGQIPRHMPPTANAASCVSFAPCVFNSSVTLSCGR